MFQLVTILLLLCAHCRFIFSAINPCHGGHSNFRNLSNPQIPSIQIHPRRLLASGSLRIQPLRRSRFLRLRFRRLFHRNPLFQTKPYFLRFTFFMGLSFPNLLSQSLAVPSEISHRRFNFLRLASLLVRRFQRRDA